MIKHQSQYESVKKEFSYNIVLLVHKEFSYIIPSINLYTFMYYLQSPSIQQPNRKKKEKWSSNSIGEILIYYFIDQSSQALQVHNTNNLELN